MSRSNVQARSLVGNGLLMGLAGGAAEVAVVGAYTLLTGGDAGVVGQGIAAAVGLGGASAGVGLAIHMGLAAALGVGLQAAFGAMRGAVGPVRFMLGSLAAVWAVNFFVVLPVVSPGFVHILPYAVTLTSKLAFGLTAAVMIGGQAAAARALGRLKPHSRHGFAGQTGV